MGNMRIVESFVTDREMVEATHFSLLKDLGLEDISIRRYTLSDRPFCINAKYTCRYNSWEFTVLHRTAPEFPEGTLCITSIESLIYGDVYEVSIPLTDPISYLNKLSHVKTIIDNDPCVYFNKLIDLIADLENSFRSYGFKVTGFLTPNLMDSKGTILCVNEDTTIYVSLMANDFDEICFCISNTLNWRRETQNTKLIKGILIPVQEYKFSKVVEFLENDVLQKELTVCSFHKAFADGYSWNK